MLKTLKIAIPTSGWATRMRPQTWSKPKSLVSVAGRIALDHVLEMFTSLPGGITVEYVFIVGPHLGETQIPAYIKEHYPGLKAQYVLQPVMKGQADALWLAREYLDGPMLMCFSDTLIRTDFSFLAGEKAGGVAWVKSVPDPRRFGVAEMDSRGWVTRLIEKPQTVENNLAVVGCYYFKQAGQLLSAIEEQFRRGTSLRGEYFLTDTINIMIERGFKMRAQIVDVWLDTGTITATLETNRYLLEHGCAHARDGGRQDVKIIPPVFIHDTARISNSVIGPHASIGEECSISNARVENSILEAGTTVDTVALTGSFIGRQAQVRGRSAEDPPLSLNIGDDSSVVLK